MINPYLLKKRNQLKSRAYSLYREGLSLREIGSLCGRSHEWARRAVAELSAKEKMVKAKNVEKIEDEIVL